MWKLPDLKRFIVATVMCGVAMAYSATPAQAALQLWITDGTTKVLTSSGTGTVNYDCGGINPACAFTGWTAVKIDVTGTGDGTIPSPPPQPDMDLSITGTTAAGSVPLTFELSQDGNSLIPVSYSFGYSDLAPTGTIGTASFYLDGSNAVCTLAGGCALTTFLGSIGPLTAPALGTAIGGPYFGPAPYSFSVQLLLDPHGHVGTMSQDVNLTTSQVPEPTSLMLLGTGLVAVGRGIRRRIRGN